MEFIFLIIKIKAAYTLIRTKVEISPCAALTSFPLALSLVNIISIEHQEPELTF